MGNACAALLQQESEDNCQDSWVCILAPRADGWRYNQRMSEVALCTVCKEPGFVGMLHVD